MSLGNLHTLQDSDSAPDSEFKQLRFAILKQLEGSIPTPYFDKNGIITIGIGFNIDFGFADTNRKYVMEAMGLTDTQKANINTAWNSPGMNAIRGMPQSTGTIPVEKNAALVTYLNGILGVPGQTFSMTDPQIKTVFDILVLEHQNAIDSLVGVPSLEQIVLTSLHYNGLVGLGLTTALALTDPAEARAEAWYQIRYDHAPELFQRRYVEGALFGLYDADGTVTEAEAKAIARMFTRHRDVMLPYDAVNDVFIAPANADLAAIGVSVRAADLSLEIEAAREFFIAAEVTARGIIRITIDGEVLVGQDVDYVTPTKTYGKNDTMTLLGKDKNDLILGGAGDDRLDGGLGDDVLIGGEGMDTYVIQGHDIIIDSGRNLILYNGALIAGVFTGDGSGSSFVGDDGRTLAFHSPGELTLSATDSVTFQNQTGSAAFAGHDFGLFLREQPLAPATTATQIGGSDNDRLDGTVDNDLLVGNGGRDLLRGGSGDDVLFADAQAALPAGPGYGGTTPYTDAVGDFVNGGGGADMLIGGALSDALMGDDLKWAA